MSPSIDEQIAANINKRVQRGQNKRTARREAAREQNQGANFGPGNFGSGEYNAAAYGGRGFDRKDAKYIKSQGGTKADVKAARDAYYAAGGQKSRLQQEGDRIRSLGSMDPSTQSISDYDTGGNYTLKDIKYLKKQGYSDEQISNDFAQRGGEMGTAVANYFNKSGQLGEGGNESLRSQAKERATSYQNNSTNNSNNTTNSNNTQNSNNTSNSNNTNNSVNDSGNTNVSDSGNADIDDSFNTDNSINDSFNDNRDQGFEVGGDLDQNIGKQGDMTTTITNSTIGAGSSIGNDYSVTIGNNAAGNNNGEGGGYGGYPDTTTSLTNMQSTAAYSALNNNQLARSRSELNGSGRSAMARDAFANDPTMGSALASNIYNLIGMQQNYWADKSTAQRGYYLGDLYGNQPPPKWVPPDAIKQPEDKTEEIAKSFDP